MNVIDFLESTSGAVTSSIIVGGALLAIGRATYQAYRKIHAIYSELTPNGGGSIKDAVNRIEALQLAGLHLTGKAYWLSEPDGKCSFASSKLAALMGTTPDQILGWGWVSFIAPEDRDRCRKEWEGAVKDLREFHMNYAYIHSDGVRVPITGHAVPVVHAQTQAVVGMIGWAEERPAVTSTSFGEPSL